MADGSNSTVTFTASDEWQMDLNREWEEAGIENDYIFSCVMRDPDIFLSLMHRILPGLNLTNVQKQTPQTSTCRCW